MTDTRRKKKRRASIDQELGLMAPSKGTILPGVGVLLCIFARRCRGKKLQFGRKSALLHWVRASISQTDSKCQTVYTELQYNSANKTLSCYGRHYAQQ